MSVCGWRRHTRIYIYVRSCIYVCNYNNNNNNNKFLAFVFHLSKSGTISTSARKARAVGFFGY